ncbi:hypothetical protein EV426DRAFT_676343 [Tirmania nivea]|nr:hypothetical protein EV426DRAFT_676343 [Tirmania nivea]
MAEIAPVMSSAGLTPPSSPLLSYQDMNTPSEASSPQPIVRPRRLKHSRCPILPRSSPDYRIPHTSLYQFPSDGSLASAYSNAGPPKVPTDAKMFTAVIPPLAAVPPTEPLPPTPPKQGIWEELCPREAVEILGSHRKGKNKAPPKLEVVVGIIKDARAEKEADRQKRGLRRMKGNVGEATGAQVSQSSPRPVATDSGLPTPGPTPPSSAKIVTPPRTLHHPKPYKLPVRKLGFGKSNKSSYSEADAAAYSDGDDDDDDDGGIAIDYVDEPQDLITFERGRRPAALDLGKPSVPGMDSPRPESPFVTGFALHFDELKGVEETEVESPTRYGYGSENEGVRLSACKKAFPEFIHSPKRVDSERAEVVELEASQPNDLTALVNTEVVMATQETHANVEENDSILVLSKDPQLDSRVVEGGTKEEKNTQNEKSKSNVDLIIHRSSILKRRHPSNSFEGSKEVIDESKLISPTPYSESWDITHQSSMHANTSNTITPPQLPRFNFIPATPLPLMSPTSVFDKQLGEHSVIPIGPAMSRQSESGADMPSTSADTAPVSSRPARPSMTRSRTVRDSRLHPWWRPRNYHLAEDTSFAKLLEGTSFAQGESARVPERDFESKAKTPRAEWTEYGPVRVDKKRKLVGVGGVQIQWVGLGGWYERIVGDKKEEGEKQRGTGAGAGEKMNLKRKGESIFD